MEFESERQLIVFLNRILEAERAGVKVLTDLLKDVEEGGLKAMMAQFLIDEGSNCQVLMTLVRHMKGEPSRKTGDFVDKIQALPSMREKLDLLVKGQEWVAKQIRKNRALFPAGSQALFLESMKIQHEENVDAMKRLLSP